MGHITCTGEDAGIDFYLSLFYFGCFQCLNVVSWLRGQKVIGTDTPPCMHVFGESVSGEIGMVLESGKEVNTLLSTLFHRLQHQPHRQVCMSLSTSAAPAGVHRALHPL